MSKCKVLWRKKVAQSSRKKRALERGKGGGEGGGKGERGEGSAVKEKSRAAVKSAACRC